MRSCTERSPIFFNCFSAFGCQTTFIMAGL
jgi:hypothetical protein